MTTQMKRTGIFNHQRETDHDSERRILEKLRTGPGRDQSQLPQLGHRIREGNHPSSTGICFCGLNKPNIAL